MKITRHYITIYSESGVRRVHYRKCGEGPPLLMVHQSPRSSAEYEPLMREWGKHFTCIAPDTPGFGQSDPLPMIDPNINDFADAICVFMQTMDMTGAAAYGFHSGGIILVAAAKRQPDCFGAIAIGAYAVWTPEEIAIFSTNYLPEFLPTNYGEHLTWLWSRMMEQTWFFPWFDVRNEARMSVAHDDAMKVHEGILDMLNAGNAYRDGYGAVLRAPRDIPKLSAKSPPCLITAYNGDPLQAHIDLLGEMPANWSARKVATRQDHIMASLEFLLDHKGETSDTYPQDNNAGFISIKTVEFDGLIHWRGRRNANILHIHAPAKESLLVKIGGGLAIDMPGHGLSDRWSADAPVEWTAWQAVIDAAAKQLGAEVIEFAPLPKGDADRLYPDLVPDRFGSHLTKAWSIARAEQFFTPWYEASAGNAQSFDSEQIKPEVLALVHRARMRAPAAKAFHQALAKR